MMNTKHLRRQKSLGDVCRVDFPQKSDRSQYLVVISLEDCPNLQRDGLTKNFTGESSVFYAYLFPTQPRSVNDALVRLFSFLYSGFLFRDANL
jgi:hypothetical protein